MTKRIVNVEFESGSRSYANSASNREYGIAGKPYAYYTDIEGIEKGDKVVVDTPSNGLTIVTVVSVTETAEGISKATKWIVDKIDLAGHKAREADRARRATLIAKLEKMAKEQSELDRFAALVASVPEAAMLLQELKEIDAK